MVVGFRLKYVPTIVCDDGDFDRKHVVRICCEYFELYRFDQCKGKGNHSGGHSNVQCCKANAGNRIPRTLAFPLALLVVKSLAGHNGQSRNIMFFNTAFDGRRSNG